MLRRMVYTTGRWGDCARIESDWAARVAVDKSSAEAGFLPCRGLNPGPLENHTAALPTKPNNMRGLVFVRSALGARACEFTVL